MPIYTDDGNYVPNFKDCATSAEIKAEYDQWCKDICYGKFCSDMGISYTKGQTESLYAAARSEAQNRKGSYTRTSESGHVYADYSKWYIFQDSEGNNTWYYTGGDATIKSNIRKYWTQMSTQSVQSKIVSSSKKVIGQGTTLITNITGHKEYDKETYDIEVGKLKNGSYALRSETAPYHALGYSAKQIREALEEANPNTYGKRRGYINNLAYAVNDNAQKASDIWRNVKSSDTSIYGARYDELGKSLEASEDPQTQYMLKNYYNGNGAAMAYDMYANKNFRTSFAAGFDVSTGKYVTIFKDKWQQSGMQGDAGMVLTGIIMGKYNTDNSFRIAVEKLASDMEADPPISETDKIERIKAINKKYGVSIPESVTAADLRSMISSNEKYQYIAKVQQIASEMIEDRINENINEKLNERFGPLLKKYGINYKFDGNTLQDIKDIIRGTKVLVFHEESFLRGLKNQLVQRLDKLIEDQVKTRLNALQVQANAKIDLAADTAIAKLDSMRKKVESKEQELVSYLNNPDALKLKIADGIFGIIKDPVGSMEQKLNKMSNIKLPLGLGNVKIGLGTVLKNGIYESIKIISTPITDMIKPILAKVAGTLTTLKNQIKAAMGYVNKIRNAAKMLVEKWKTTIMNQIKKYEKILIDKIINFVRINITGSIASSFSVGSVFKGFHL